MNYSQYRYQFGIIVVSIAFIIASYMIILKMTDSIFINYEIYSSAGDIAGDPGSIDRRQDILFRGLAEKQAILEGIMSRKEFSQDIFRDLAQKYRCRLIKLENRGHPEEKKIEYDVVFSGTISRLLNLLNSLETKYLLQIRQVAMVAHNEPGTVVRMSVVLSVDMHDGI